MLNFELVLIVLGIASSLGSLSYSSEFVTPPLILYLTFLDVTLHWPFQTMELAKDFIMKEIV